MLNKWNEMTNGWCVNKLTPGKDQKSTSINVRVGNITAGFSMNLSNKIISTQSDRISNHIILPSLM
jgi:hypothetical protein